MRTPANLVALVLAALGVIVLLAAIGYANSVIGFVGFVSVGLLLLGGGMAISNSTPKKTCPSCSAWVNYNEPKCKHCGSDLTAHTP